MTYELAKQLKDAGFVQENIRESEKIAFYAYCSLEDCCAHELHLIHHDNDEGGIVGNNYNHGSYSFWSINNKKDSDEYWNKIQSQYIFCPTLSELIEACPKEKNVNGTWGFQLYVDSGNWVAGYPYNINWRFKGSTPEEAVAKLWLALNKK